MSVLSSVENGLVKGFDYDVKYAKLLIWAAGHNRADAIADLAHIASVHVQEIKGEATDVTNHTVEILISAFLFGHDPFSGSRHLLQTALTKYGSH